MHLHLFDLSVWSVEQLTVLHCTVGFQKGGCTCSTYQSGQWSGGEALVDFSPLRCLVTNALALRPISLVSGAVEQLTVLHCTVAFQKGGCILHNSHIFALALVRPISPVSGAEEERQFLREKNLILRQTEILYAMHA